MIFGNTEGVKDIYIHELEKIYKMTIYKKELLNAEIIEIISRLTGLINREISVAITRKGKVMAVSIGDAESVELPLFDVMDNKLSGVRVIHTHPNGNSTLSIVDISALLKMRLDAMVAIGVEEGVPLDISIGFCNIKNDVLIAERTQKLSIEDAIEYDFLNKVYYTEDALLNIEEVKEESERAILVSLDSMEMLDELEELAYACDVKVVDKVLQRNHKPETATYVGSGKANELSMLKQVRNANVVIFDDELTGAQVKNLEEIIGVKVIDRTTLILDIFAKRAKTREAKIQVELAQLKYRSSRLLGLGIVMSRTGGGIGTKGPGEKKLEIDKRKIRDQIYDLNKELIKIKKTRSTQREKRVKSDTENIALVGYTNAGKSTLRNLLASKYSKDDMNSKEGVFAENMLFATLDTTTRSIELSDRRNAAITDTVGFVRKLPHDLVAAFKSTLEEVISSDLLLHVVDASSDAVFAQIEAVNSVLTELEAVNKPQILVLNKTDLAQEDVINKIKKENPNIISVEISAKNDINIDSLMKAIIEKLPNKLIRVKYNIPYSETSIGAYLHRHAIVLKEEYEADGLVVEAEVDTRVYNKTKAFISGELNR